MNKSDLPQVERALIGFQRGFESFISLLRIEIHDPSIVEGKPEILHNRTIQHQRTAGRHGAVYSVLVRTGGNLGGGNVGQKHLRSIFAASAAHPENTLLEAHGNVRSPVIVEMDAVHAMRI